MVTFRLNEVIASAFMLRKFLVGMVILEPTNFLSKTTMTLQKMIFNVLSIIPYGTLVSILFRMVMALKNVKMVKS